MVTANGRQRAGRVTATIVGVAAARLASVAMARARLIVTAAEVSAAPSGILG